MGYQALYRTYRPKCFKEVVGQELVVRTLQNAIGQGKISHAYLFSGPRGTGKTSVARIFAKALICNETQNLEPCCRCNRCKEIAESSYPDVLEMDAASNNGVDQIREIREKVQFLPSAAAYKIYIVDEAHMLTQAAFNALLKILEEPPKHVIFILATTEPEKLPKTIISRCQRFDFRILSAGEIFNKLREIINEEEINATDEALNAIAEASEGAMRDALSILDQAISYAKTDIVDITDVASVTGNVEYKALIKLIEAIAKLGAEQVISTAEELYAEGKEVSKIVRGLIQIYRDMLLYKNAKGNAKEKHIYSYDKFISLCEEENEVKIFHFIELLSDVLDKIKYAVNPRVHFEIALIKMIKTRGESIDTITRLNALEAKLAEINLDSNNGNNLAEFEQMRSQMDLVVSELNKLEIPRLKDRVKNLEETEENRPKISNAHFEARIDELEQKMLILEMSGGVGNAETTDTHFNDEAIEMINKKITLLQEKFSIIENRDDAKSDIATLNNKISIINEKLDSYISKEKGVEIDLNENANAFLEDVLEQKLDEKLSELNINLPEKQNESIYQKISALEAKLQNFNSQNKTEINKDLEERLKKLETTLFDFIQGSLYEKSPIKKASNSKQAQFAYTGTEYEKLTDLKKQIEPRADFGIFAKTEEEKNAERRRLEEIKREEQILLEQEEKRRHDEEEKIRLRKLELLEIEKQKREEEIKKAEELLKLKQQAFAEKREAEFLEKQQALINEEKAKEQEHKKLLEDIDKQREQILDQIKENQIKRDEAINAINQFKEEKAGAESEAAPKSEVVRKNNPNLVITSESDSREITENKDFWFYRAFSIKYVENIMIESLKEGAKEEKNRVLSIFSNGLSQRVDITDVGNSDLLNKGLPAVVGNGKMILVYNDVTLCNTTMEPNFYDRAVKILTRALGKIYEYISLPEDVWLKIREDFRSQFANGSQKPVLKPIKCPELIDLTKLKKDKTEVEEAREELMSFFNRKE